MGRLGLVWPGVAALLIGAMSSPASGAETYTSDRDHTLQILESIAAEAGGFGLRAWVNAGADAPIPIGHHVEYHFLSEGPGHLTVLHLDSHGVATLIHPNGLPGSNQISPGVQQSFPSADAGFAVEAEPPLGTEFVLVLVTPDPITASDLGISLTSDPIAVVEAADATALADRLRARFAGFGPSKRAAASFQQRIVGRSASEEYDSVDIVSYFTERTRSIRRPRLDLHVHFESGSHDLDPSAKGNLDSVASALMDPRMQEMSFKVSGHTDDVGDTTYNDALSRARAQAVIRYLTEAHAVTPDRLEVHFYGERRPLEPNDTPEARQLNRRVEFELIR